MLINNFQAYELFDPITYAHLVKNGYIKVEFIVKEHVIHMVERYVHPHILSFFKKEMIKDLLLLRKRYVHGIRINNWHKHQPYVNMFKENNYNNIINYYYNEAKNIVSLKDDAGTRPMPSALSSQLSTHIMRIALDMEMIGYEAQEVRLDIVKNHNDYSVTRLEAKVPWVHGDYLITNSTNIILFEA